MPSDRAPLRPLVSPQLAEAAHSHFYFSGKLGKTVAEFIQKFGAVHESMCSQLLMLVDTYRKKTAELTKSTSGAHAASFMGVWSKLLMAVEQEAKIFQNFSSSTNTKVVAPMLNVISEKKLIWSKCFHFVEMYRNQVLKKEEDLGKQFREYADAYGKLKLVEHDPVKVERHMSVCHNYHNAYLLLLSSVNGMNGYMYADLLPKVLHECESANAALSKSIADHLKALSSVRQSNLSEIAQLHQEMREAYQTLDLPVDFRTYLSSAEGHITDNRLKYFEFCHARDAKEFLKLTGTQCRMNSSSEGVIELDASFVVDAYTVPSLMRKLAHTRKQIDQLEKAISSGRSHGRHKNKQGAGNEVEESAAVMKIKERLIRFDRQAKLRVLQTQMELFNPSVLDSLGPVPDHILDDLTQSESSADKRHRPASASFSSARPSAGDGQKAHMFLEHKFLKPGSCFFCKGLLIAPIGQCVRCKYCKMQVHKKCAENVPFCLRVPIRKTRKVSNAPSPSPSSTDAVTAHDERAYSEVGSDSDFDSFDDEFSEFGNEDYEMPPDALQNSSGDNLPPPLVPTPVSKPPVLGPKPSGSPLPAVAKDPAGKRLSMPILSSEKEPFQAGKELPRPPLVQKPVVVSKKPALPARQISKPAEYCVALYDYKSSQDSDLPLRAGQKILLSEKSNSDWWKGIFEGQEGYFPSQYVMGIEPSDAIVRCLYSFDAADEEEVSVIEGQIVILEREEDAEWLYIRTHLNKRGLVPTSYCEILR